MPTKVFDGFGHTRYLEEVIEPPIYVLHHGGNKVFAAGLHLLVRASGGQS